MLPLTCFLFIKEKESNGVRGGKAAMKGGIVVIAPSLSPNTLAIVRGLNAYECLDHFVTTVAIRRPRLVPQPFRRFIETLADRRPFPEFLPAREVTRYPFREIVRSLINRYGRNEILADYVWEWAERGFDRRTARAWAGGSKFIYGFELASVETFEAQKKRGGCCVLGQWITHYGTSVPIFDEEVRRYPEAATAYDRHVLTNAPEIALLKDRQYAASDLIVANSEFVKESFVREGFDPDRIVVVPTGGPGVQVEEAAERIKDRVVFISAGSQSLRKGTHYLLDAWRRLNARAGAELWMIGKNTLPDSMTQGLSGRVERRPSVPRSELYSLFRKVSVLVLPSLCEGFAFVILEAMANGLPVITTPNSGCDKFVEDGVNGWIVPIRDVNALAGRMQECLDRPERLREMGEASRRKAAAWTWSDYAERHTDEVVAFMKRAGMDGKA